MDGAVVFCFKYAAYGVMDGDIVEVMCVFGRREVHVEAGGEVLSLNGGKDGVRVLENGAADRKERTLEMGKAGSGAEGFWLEMLDGCKLDKLEDTEVKL